MSKVEGSTVIDLQNGLAAGVMGGGMASGNTIAIAEDGSAKDAAGARVEVANINISGGVIGEEKAGMQGNIYGTTWVGTSNITVAGGTINGDIYGGGLSIGGNYGVGHECYNDALSAVDTANVTLGAGTLNGSVYLGGRVLEDGANNKGVARQRLAPVRSQSTRTSSSSLATPSSTVPALNRQRSTS